MSIKITIVTITIYLSFIITHNYDQQDDDLSIMRNMTTGYEWRRIVMNWNANDMRMKDNVNGGKNWW